MKLKKIQKSMSKPIKDMIFTSTLKSKSPAQQNLTLSPSTKKEDETNPKKDKNGGLITILVESKRAMGVNDCCKNH